MRKMLLLLLLTPVFSFAQSDASVNAFLASRPDNLGIPISLPEKNYYLLPDMHDSEGKHTRKFITSIQSDSVYHQLFSRYIYTKEYLKNLLVTTDSFYYKLTLKYLRDSIPVIDFSKYELVLYSACGQCLAFCKHETGKHESCHRNACHMQDAWYLRHRKEQLIGLNKLLK